MNILLSISPLRDFLHYPLVTLLLPASAILYMMDATNLPQIFSFIIRFVLEETPAEEKSYRGTIRHIQTAEEINFSEWHEATAFMHRFVSLAELQSPSRSEPPITNL